VRLGVLGPLLVVDDEGLHVPVPSPRLRVLLAALLLHADSPVPAESLAELVWDGAPPAGAPVTLRSYVRRLRMGLGPAWAQRIVTSPPGYLCRADEQEVDTLRFAALCRQTDTAVRERRWEQASQAAELAALLWRGTPLLDVPCQTLHDEFTPRLEQLRTQMLENQAEAALALGRHEHWVQPLRELVTAHPLRERFHAQLMQALAGCGRQAEALAAYQDARKLLVRQLGIEPGPELRQLHKRILANEGDPAAPRTSAEQALEIAPMAAAVPRQLPVATRHFTGRRDELDLITGLHRSSQPTDVPGGTVVISAIDGMAGIGKTTLAIHAAHRLAEQFPDGQLFLDLHGYTEGQRPRTADQALGWLLRALSVSPERIPPDVEQAAALYRQHLADTRTLIVLDNAATEAQVRPLLPGTDSCLVLVTSRRRLKGLDDAHALSLEVLPTTEAVALLCAVAGLDHLPSEDPLPTEIAELCGHLPLALRIAAALLRHRPAWGLEHLAGLLREQHRRIQALSDGERDLGCVLDLSYRSLDEPHRTLWRRLGLIPGPDLDAYAVAALLDRDAEDATRLLEDLVDHNLLLCHAPGRYRLHDLLRVHAHTLAAADPAPERDGALDRLLHYYAHTARIASIHITRCPPRAPADLAPAHAPDLPDPETARAWLRTERDNLEHARAYAHTHNLHEHTLALTAGLAEILRTDGPYIGALALHQAAADTAERHGHPAAHANALADLGIMQRLAGDLDGAVDTFAQALKIYRTTDDQRSEADVLAEIGRARGYAGDLTRAVDTFTQALAIYRRTGERRGEADMLAELGIMRRVSGELAGADDAFGRALEIYRATDDRHGEADALTELGRVRALAGDLAGARDAFGRALGYYRATGHHHGEAYALTNLGAVLRRTGDLADAANALTGALEIYRAVGYGQGEAEALTNLGTVLREAGKPAEADDAQARALEIYREIGSRHDEAWALNHHAATIAARGDLPRALALYQRALRMNIELDKPDGQALALEGLGECRLNLHETETGAASLHEALTIYQRLGMAPDAERVRDRLAGLTAI
jgi:DNA-binding SARP family transcriptional activator